MIRLMRNSQIYEMTLLLRALYLGDDVVFTQNIRIIINSFVPILRFLSNHDEYKLIKDLFKRFEEYNQFKNKQHNIPITTQKLELLFDDDCSNLPVLKDFDCLKQSESDRLGTVKQSDTESM